MKSILLFTSASLIAALTATPTAVPREPGQAPSFGVYDPETHCPGETQLSFKHVFVSWASYTPGDILRQLQAIQASGHLLPLSHGPIRRSPRLPQHCWAMSRQASMTKEFKPWLWK